MLFYQAAKPLLFYQVAGMLAHYVRRALSPLSPDAQVGHVLPDQQLPTVQEAAGAECDDFVTPTQLRKRNRSPSLLGTSTSSFGTG